VDATRRYTEATQRTATDLRTIAESDAVRELSHLSLPEIRALTDLIAQVAPAGNVPGMILNGLIRISDRRQMAEAARRDVDMLLRGVEQVLDTAIYSTLFAGPAAVLWGYQNLLKLAGKSVEDFFPDGAWQFYVEYALREDTARHAVETHGFDTLLKQHGIRLAPADRLTAWTMASIHCLHQYPELLKNEWRERVYLNLLAAFTAKLPNAVDYAGVARTWSKQIPYSRGEDAAPDEPYSLYRRRRFDLLLEEKLASLPSEHHLQWVTAVQTAKKVELPAFQRQMSILARLQPEAYAEHRLPLAATQAQVGLIHQGSYYLIPICQPGDGMPCDVHTVRAQIRHIFHNPTAASDPLRSLARLRRASWVRLKRQFDSALMGEFEALSLAPILINADRVDVAQPLAVLRQTERGVGGHALTLFDSGDSFVFDMSHIFFDGLWGAAMAEILTNEAISWAVYLNKAPHRKLEVPRPRVLNFHFSAENLAAIAESPRITIEANAESDKINIQAILTLRKLFERRNERIRLTANDILLLYRAIHAVTYQPDADLLAALTEAAENSATRIAGRSALGAIENSSQNSPAILIPIDASQRNPRERLYPLNFEVPLSDLALTNLHQRTLSALDAYQDEPGERSAAYQKFDTLQRTYLATLAGFGEVIAKAKQIGAEGGDTSIGVLKLVGVLPPAIQNLLEKIPQRSDMLNDLIRGREVFSNLGAVAKSSSLGRFITAKDDNEGKTLAWGMITDAGGTLHISLRDFRPHVAQLQAANRADLATWIAHDYLNSYVAGLNEYIRELRKITLASRETRLERNIHG